MSPAASGCRVAARSLQLYWPVRSRRRRGFVDRQQGVALTTVSSVPARPEASRPSDDARLRRAAWVALVVGVLLVAAGLRLWAMPNPPPALNVDEAADGQDALDILAGHPSVFFPRVNGREPLWMYAQAGSIAVLGNTPLALRFPMAGFGLLTVAATYAVGRDWFGRRVGLLAAASLGSAFWHLTLTRTALRTGAVPLFVVLCFYALGRAVATKSRAQAMLAGVWLACGLYTYLSMRMVAVALLVGFGAQVLLPWLGARRWRERYLRAGFVAAAVAAVLVIPLGLYFAQHRELLFERVVQVSVFNPNPHIIGRHMGLGESLLRTAGGFFVRGDESWKQNIPGRPVFDPLNGALWLAGMVALLVGFVRFLRHRGPRPWSAELWLLLWPAVVFGGMALAQESPYYPRQSAAIPAVQLCWAVGASAAIAWAGRRSEALRRAAAVVVALALTVQTAASARDLFLRWGPAPQTWQEFDGDIYDMVGALRASGLAQTDARRMVIQLDAASGVELPLPVTAQSVWVRQYTSAVVLPAAGAGDALYLYPHLAFDPPLPKALPELKPELQGDKPAGGRAWLVYRLPAATLARLERPPRSIDAAFGPDLTLVGGDLGVAAGPVRAGGEARISLTWRVNAPDRRNYGLYVHLLDDQGHTWAVSDEQADLPNGWAVGQKMVSAHRLAVPADAPPGAYRLVAGAGLRSLDEQPSRYLTSLGPEVTIGTVQVAAAAAPGARPQIDAPLSASAGGLALVGRGAYPARARQGQVVEVPLTWRKVSEPGDAVAGLALVRDDGAPVASEALASPGGAAFPPSSWPLGRYVREYATIHIPPTLPGGAYRLVLRVRGASESPEQTVEVGRLGVEERPRSYAVPAVEHPARATFGGSLRLLGYDVDGPAEAGKALTVRLVWQDVATPPQNLTVFVHLLDPSGRIVAQRDSQPLGGEAVTSGWLPGEVVADAYAIPLPAGTAGQQLTPEIGWYDAATGARVPLTAGGSGDHLLLAPIRVAQ